MFRFILVLFFFLFFNIGFAQEFQFIGLIKFDKTNIISYKLVLSKKNGKISGYSITDFQGENETKNKIIGDYNDKTQQLNFTEKDIIYTKSKIIQNDFCYLNFKGKVNLKEKISGSFLSIFNDEQVCLKGTINLVSAEKAKKRMKKFDNKIQKSSVVSNENKKEINLEKFLDELKSDVLKKNELTSIYFNSDEIQLEIWDSSAEDGDEISIDLDNETILSHYKILNKKKYLKIKLDKEITVIKITANNVGEYPPNTAKINISNKEKTIELVSKLNLNEVTSLQIIKKK